MTKHIRVWSGMAVTLLVLVLAGCGRPVELTSSVPAAEANEILAALQNAGISAEKIPGKDGLAGVSIPASEMGRAVDLLRERGLPRERFTGMGQVFKKEGLISSPTEERARYLYALSQELGATLSQIDGVVIARVHVVLPERTVFGEAPVPSSAAVFIKHQDGYNLDTLQPLVRRLVTNSIPGLTPEKVSIVLLSAQAARVKSDAAGAFATAPGVGALVLLMAVILVASLGCCGYLLWKFWWPTRARARRIAASQVT